MIEIFGYIAASLTTFAFLPQAVMTVKSKDTDGISLPMYLLFVFGVVFWAVYGVMTMQWPIIIANILTAGFAMTVLYYKLTEKKRKQLNSVRQRVVL